MATTEERDIFNNDCDERKEITTSNDRYRRYRTT